MPSQLVVSLHSTEVDLLSSERLLSYHLNVIVAQAGPNIAFRGQPSLGLLDFWGLSRGLKVRFWPPYAPSECPRPRPLPSHEPLPMLHGSHLSWL